MGIRPSAEPKFSLCKNCGEEIFYKEHVWLHRSNKKVGCRKTYACPDFMRRKYNCLRCTDPVAKDPKFDKWYHTNTDKFECTYE